MPIVSIRADELRKAVRAASVQGTGIPSSQELRANLEGSYIRGVGGNLVIQIPLPTATVEAPGTIALDVAMSKRLATLGTQMVRLDSAADSEHASEVTFHTDAGATGWYRVRREREDARHVEAFVGFRGEAQTSAAVLRHALDVASTFTSEDERDAGMSRGCVSVAPGRVTATDGTKAVIIVSRRLPRVTACLRRDAAAGIARIARGARDGLVSVAVAPGGVRVTDAKSGVSVVALGQTVRARSNLHAPTEVPVLFTIEAEAREFAWTLGFLRGAKALWARPEVVERDSRVAFKTRSGGACITAEMPVRGGVWTGIAGRVPEVPFAALESVIDGLAAARATIEFRMVGQGCLVTSVEHIAFKREGATASETAREETTVTRCALSPASDPKDVPGP
jgi:hypothetical protein